MIVPAYWAEAKITEKVNGRQVTVRRFGWSDVSEEDAQEVANQRVTEAFERIVRGEKLERREIKQAYNGAAGVPIREEILSRHGEVVVTRNSYGAHCLNTPDVLFADVDVEGPEGVAGCAIGLVAFTAGLAAGWTYTGSFKMGVVIGVVAVIVAAVVRSIVERIVYTPEAKLRLARGRIEQFARGNPEWHLRLYRTPAGWRVLVMHKTFSADDAEVAGFFAAVGTDPVYVRMCQNQKCFRARVSPKPWRIGIADHMRPRPGVWPVAPERMERRTRWVREYEKRAAGYAACEFVAELGSKGTDAQAKMVQELHDELSRATRKLPIA